MTHLELVRKVFPDVQVVQEGESIIIDSSLRISPVEVEKKSIKGIVKVRGWELVEDTGNDIIYCEKGFFVNVISEAAGRLASNKAHRIMDFFDPPHE